MGTDLAKLPLTTPNAATEEQCRDAALFICGQARDRADAEQLMEACGLLPYKSGRPAKSRPDRQPATGHSEDGQ